MNGLRGGLRVLAVQLRLGAVNAMQYRADFVMQGLMAVMWVGVAVVPLMVVYQDRTHVAGWSWPQAMVVMGAFTFMKAVLEGVISPSLAAVVEHVRKGTLDFILLKPVDAQWLVSTARLEPWRVLDMVGALGLVVLAMVRLGRWPSALQVIAAAVLLAMGVLVMHSLWVLVVCLSFRVVRVDNLGYLLASLFDAARWPVTVFRGALQLLFTWVLPLAMMTTWPAMAVLGSLAPQTAVAAAGLALGFFAVSRVAWLASLKYYTSASS